MHGAELCAPNWFSTNDLICSNDKTQRFDFFLSLSTNFKISQLRAAALIGPLT